MEGKEKFLIIDGNSIMNRAFYGIRLLSVKDGTYTNAVYGFLNIYYMMENMLKPDYVAVAFDLSAPTFRHKMYDGYKAGRRSMPDELRPQMDLIKDVLRAMNIPILQMEGYEADDILGTVASSNTQKDIFTYVLTGDKDSLQLISNTTSVIMPGKKDGKTEYTIYTPELLKESMNVTPSQIIDLKALMGDKSDNIPGVPKVGEKTATSLLDSYSDIENIYNNIDTLEISENLRSKLKENKELAYLSKTLATINTNIPIELDYDLLKLGDVNLPELSKIFTRLSFKKFLDRYLTDGETVELNTESQNDFYKNLDNTKFQVVKTSKELENILNNNKTNMSFIYLDNKYEYEKFKNVLLFSFENTNIIYILKLYSNVRKDVLKAFCSSECEKIGYNIKPLLKLAFDNDIKDLVGFNQDIMIAYYLINATDSNHTIQNIAYNLLDINIPELKKETKKAVQTSIFDMLNTNDNENTDKLNDLNEQEFKLLYTYINVIFKANESLNKNLIEDELCELYNNIEIPLIETLANIESNGMYIDKEKLKKFGIYLEESINALTIKIYELAGEQFNINSPQQLGKILFEKLLIPYPKKNKTSYSTDKEILESISDKHEIVPLVLEYRTLAKLKSTYVDSLISVISEDGRIHTTFMQALTATGRLSSVEPNLQNIPVKTELGAKIRECFVCQKEGYKIIDADYSQIELRVLADMSEDSNMIKAYTTNQDIHAITASQVFNVPLEQVTKELRSKAKAVNFGIVYGISEFGLAKNINSSREQAKQYIENYFKHYSNIEKYMKDLINTGLETGFAKTKFGRKRRVDELKSANYNTRMFGERIAMNMPIQGTAADIMKIAMNNLYKMFKEENLKSKIIMQVHDELIIEAHESELEYLVTAISDCMSNAAKLRVPLVADVNVGNSWMEAK